MTNGEKLKEIFPNGVLTSVYNSIYWGDDILVSKSWWNAEYKESTTNKNNLGVEYVSRQTEHKPSGTYEEMVTFHLGTIATMLADISKSLAILANKAESEDNNV